MLAASLGSAPVVKELLSLGANIFLLDSSLSSVLHHVSKTSTEKAKLVLAVLSEHLEANKTILGPEFLDKKNDRGDSSLLVACEKKNFEVASWLVAQCGSSMNGSTLVNSSNSQTRVTPLQIAVKRRSELLVTLLLHSGAIVDAEDINGESAFSLASKQPTTKIGKLVQEKRSQIPTEIGIIENIETLDISGTSTDSFRTPVKQRPNVN